MSHSLVEISRSEWTKLRDLYVEHQKHASGYYTLQNFIDWTAKNPDLKVKIYSLDGDWQQDGTFILNDPYGSSEHQHFFYYINTLSENTDRLVQALNCLDNTSSYLLAGFPDRLVPAVHQHFAFAGFSKEDFKPDQTVWHHIPKEQALQFTVDVPEGLSLAPLSSSNAEQVNSVWPHRSPGSVVFVNRLIEYNDNIGVFDKDGQLLAWCLRLPLGALGLLQVEEKHKRRGLGGLVVRYMSKVIAEKGDEVMAPVVIKNVASRGLFEKLGFQIIDKVYWVMKPKHN